MYPVQYTVYFNPYAHSMVINLLCALHAQGAAGESAAQQQGAAEGGGGLSQAVPQHQPSAHQPGCRRSELLNPTFFPGWWPLSWFTEDLQIDPSACRY